jgi:hypothetical protein
LLLKRSKRKKLVQLQEKKKSRKKVVVAASIALVLVGGAAFAYWTMRGDGTGSATADGQALVIVQDAPKALAPGETITLAGTIRNPNTTSVKLGILTPMVTDSGKANIKDFKLGGKSVTDATLIPGNATIRWSGLTLEYIDSPTENQDSGMDATVALSYSLSQYTAPAAGYNAIPAHVDGNVPSVGFQATSTSEFGDAVTLSGASRTINSMSVLFSSWGCQTGSGITCETTSGATFNVPVTFTVYKSVGGKIVDPGTPLSQTTKTVAFAYRPSADNSKCTGADAGKLFNSKISKCENGSTQLVTMAMPATSPLTSEVVWTVKYNTFSHGDDPTNVASGADSLNVGAMSFPGAPFSGTDVDEDLVMVTSTWSEQTPNGWTGYRPLGAITTK